MWVVVDVLHVFGDILSFRQDDLSTVWARLSGCSTPVNVVRYALYPLRRWVAIGRLGYCTELLPHT